MRARSILPMSSETSSSAELGRVGTGCPVSRESSSRLDASEDSRATDFSAATIWAARALASSKSSCASSSWVLRADSGVRSSWAASDTTCFSRALEARTRARNALSVVASSESSSCARATGSTAVESTPSDSAFWRMRRTGPNAAAASSQEANPKAASNTIPPMTNALSRLCIASWLDAVLRAAHSDHSPVVVFTSLPTTTNEVPSSPELKVSLRPARCSTTRWMSWGRVSSFTTPPGSRTETSRPLPESSTSPEGFATTSIA